jgi:hypothetical protein
MNNQRVYSHFPGQATTSFLTRLRVPILLTAYLALSTLQRLLSFLHVENPGHLPLAW